MPSARSAALLINLTLAIGLPCIACVELAVAEDFTPQRETPAALSLRDRLVIARGHIEAAKILCYTCNGLGDALQRCTSAAQHLARVAAHYQELRTSTPPGDDPTRVDTGHVNDVPPHVHTLRELQGEITMLLSEMDDEENQHFRTEVSTLDALLQTCSNEGKAS